MLHQNIISFVKRKWPITTSKIKFILQTQKLAIPVAILLAFWFIPDFFSDWRKFDDLKEFWNEELDQEVYSMTLLVAILVRWNEIIDSWRANLPKRLTVRFLDKDFKLWMECEKAVLAHEADIRNMGQQIGRQMNKDTNLSLSPSVQISSGKVIPSDDFGTYLHYEVSFVLYEKPKNLPTMEPNQHLHWKFPFTLADLVVTGPSPCRASSFN